MEKIIFSIFLIFISFNFVTAQNKLQPYFNPVEYSAMLSITDHQVDTSIWNTLPFAVPQGYKMVYRSDSVGLDNRWDLWLRDDSVGVISIRGTTLQANSWAEDFYAAMTPATGTIIISPENIFAYKLAEHPRAFVHSGWLIGMASLAPDIVKKINEYYNKGVKDYLIMGHSQGGAISYLLTSYLYYFREGQIPDDVKFKTYSSAPPKPGNLFYAYDYDNITKGGWSLRVYNSEDWVPETPLTVQTLDDFSKVNPYSDLDSITSKMGLIDKIIFDLMVGEIANSLTNARDILNDYMGNLIYMTSISKYLPQLGEPSYAKTMDYYPAGVPVVLMVTPDYNDYVTSLKLPYLFENHLIQPYMYLLQKNYLDK